MVATFHIEAAKRRHAYRAAKMALLKLQARQTIERTDASARQVEKALAHLVQAMTDEMIIPAISGIAADLRDSSTD